MSGEGANDFYEEDPLDIEIQRIVASMQYSGQADHARQYVPAQPAPQNYSTGQAYQGYQTYQTYPTYSGYEAYQLPQGQQYTHAYQHAQAPQTMQANQVPQACQDPSTFHTSQAESQSIPRNNDASSDQDDDGGDEETEMHMRTFGGHYKPEEDDVLNRILEDDEYAKLSWQEITDKFNHHFKGAWGKATPGRAKSSIVSHVRAAASCKRAYELRQKGRKKISLTKPRSKPRRGKKDN